MTLLSERGESNKTNANKVSYEASYEAPLTRKTRLKCMKIIMLLQKLFYFNVHQKPMKKRMSKY